jgi:uncharacterized protein YecT (DUF1311 family)
MEDGSVNNKIISGMKCILYLFGLLALSVQAASFDCAKAGTKIEKLICADAEISKLDEELNAAYKTTLQDEKRAGTIKKAQKQWMKERNSCADAACVKRAYEMRLSSIAVTHTSSDEAEHEGVTPDKPGFFRLDQSTNDKVCSLLSQIINDDIKEYGETNFDTHTEFAKWRKVEESRIDRGDVRKYDGMVEQADMDINNDGVVDQVIRTQWSMHSVLDDSLNILSRSEKKIVIADLINSGNMITFTGHYWLDRHQKKYSNHLIDGWEWYFHGVAAINLFQQNDETYVVAQSYAVSRNVSAKIYVFQLDKEYKKYEEKDVCMFVRICPCGGSEGLRGNERTKTLPASKWCHK